MNQDELKLIVQILADQSKAQKDIDRTVKLLQSYVSKNKGLYIDLQVDEKSASSALKAHEKTQEALAKSISNQRKRREKDDFNQSKAINKAIDDNYIASQKTQESLAKSLSNRQNRRKKDELNQSKAINDALENDYIASQKTQEAIAKTMSVRRRELMKSEFDQAKAINKQLLEQYDWKTVGVTQKFKLNSDFQTFLNENPRVMKLNSERAKELQQSISNINNKADLRKAKGEISAFQSEMKATGLAGRNFAQEILHNLGKVINWLGLTTIVFAAMRSVKSLFTNVVELDHAMTNLRKVTDETSTTYDKFVDSAASSAKRLGVTLVDIVKSTSEFAKLGYSLSQAQTLAETASVYSMVGDMSIQNATESLISSMKAFGVEAKDSISIVDKFNKVGKIYCPAA